jgi:hypothetical protein
MLFTIQTYLEEYLSKRNMVDSDGYTVRLANLYFYYRSNTEDALFFSKVGHIRTVLFLNNGIEDRKDFEQSLIRRLDNKFKKKLGSNNSYFPGGTELEKENLQHLPKITIDILLNEFRHATEARAIDAFWISRIKGTLRQRPEKIAQALFTLFTKGTLINRSGILLREFQSGIGFVDVGIIFSSTLHLVEIKVITDDFTGLGQLEQYMKTEKRQEGSLLIFDSLKPDEKIDLPARINTSAGVVKIYRVDINPRPPSSLI